jgi:hypothetical protein
MDLSLNPYKNQSISMGKGGEITIKVTLAFWWKNLGKDLGRRTSLQFTPISCDISYFINRIYDGCFPLIDFLCEFMYSLI